VIVYDEANASNIVWVKGQWTCEEGLATISAAVSVTIIDVASLSLIENPVKIKTDGSIFAGTLDANDNPVLSGARMLINKRGLFLYDSNDLNGTNPTTQIIGEDNGVTATFITQKAKIANWVISSGKIENTLNATTGTYAGLSPSGTYAFWAGGGVAGGYSVNANEDAKFSVTSAGYVKAKNLHITGGTIKVGSNFEVDTDGLVKAVNAELSGVIKASSGILGSIDIGGTIKVNGVDTVFPGQLRVTVPGTSGGKVEIGQLATVLGSTVGSGIQVTNTTNGIYAQLDPVNGIIARKGSIGGWAITDTSINNGENIGFYNTTTLSDIAIWAGGNRAGTPGPNFSVTYGGSLIAKEATLSGSIEARSGYFGLYDATSKKITSGWKINGKFLESFIDGSSTVKVKLDGLQGTIAGGNIVGSNVFFWNPTNWYAANTGADSPDPGTWNPETGSGTGNPGNIDYISSSGNFRLANGNLTYNGSEFKVKTDLVASNVFLGGASFSSDYLLGKSTTIGGVTKSAGNFSLGNRSIVYENGIFSINPDKKAYAAFKIALAVQSDNNGTAGDTTVVQNQDGFLTTGRAFFYAGNNYPDGASSRSQFNDGDQGTKAFSVGDIILSRKA
jgi:hypothetical protein